jgi:Kef-type K+ transport system membrane component KefB
VQVSFENLLAVSVLAFAAPLLVTVSGRLRIRFAVLEIVLGIVVGPAGLGWVHVEMRLITQAAAAALVAAGFDAPSSVVTLGPDVVAMPPPVPVGS